MVTKRALKALGLSTLLAWAIIANAQSHYSGRLSTVPIDFRTQAVTTGVGAMSAELDGNQLTIAGSFEGLSGPATIAKLHVGMAPGVRGPAAHDLMVSQATSGEVTGTLRLNRRELEALRAGHLYIQIHSDVAPEGNLWGWLFD